MEKIYELVVDKSRWEVDVREKNFGHSAHQFCQVCAGRMRFKVTEHTPRYSGYTGNVVLDLIEYCPAGCEEFTLTQIYRCRTDDKLYVNNFIEIEEYKEHLLERGEQKWNKKI